MANTYTWSVESINCYPEYQDQKDVVFMVNWRVNAVDDASNKATSYGAQAIDIKIEEAFTPFSELTEQQVIGWVQTTMGSDKVALIISGLDKQLKDAANPPIVSPTLPWIAKLQQSA